MGQMGYPKMGPDGSFAGFQQPGQPQIMGSVPPMAQSYYPPGFAAGEPVTKKRLWEQYSYMDDFSRGQGWVLNQLARVFHERSRALQVCIPSAPIAAFLVIFAIISVMNIAESQVEATLQQCKVLHTRIAVLKEDKLSPRYRPTLHVQVKGQAGERQVTRFRDPADWEPDREAAQKYLNGFCVGCNIPCYQFEDGSLHLDEADYASIWDYVIMVVLLLSAFVCCCIWMA